MKKRLLKKLERKLKQLTEEQLETWIEELGVKLRSPGKPTPSEVSVDVLARVAAFPLPVTFQKLGIPDDLVRMILELISTPRQPVAPEHVGEIPRDSKTRLAEVNARLSSMGASRKNSPDSAFQKIADDFMLPFRIIYPTEKDDSIENKRLAVQLAIADKLPAALVWNMLGLGDFVSGARAKERMEEDLEIERQRVSATRDMFGLNDKLPTQPKHEPTKANPKGQTPRPKVKPKGKKK